MTDQFKDGFLEHLLSTLKSDKRRLEYTSSVKINGDLHWLHLDCWLATTFEKVDKARAEVSIKKYNTYQWIYREDKSYAILEYDEFGHEKKILTITKTEELNNIITTFTHNSIKKNPWMIYSKEECAICKEDKDYVECEKLKTCSHSFCMSCLDTLVKLPRTEHKCPMCRKRFKEVDHNGDLCGSDEE